MEGLGHKFKESWRFGLHSRLIRKQFIRKFEGPVEARIGEVGSLERYFMAKERVQKILGFNGLKWVQNPKNGVQQSVFGRGTPMAVPRVYIPVAFSLFVHSLIFSSTNFPHSLEN